MKGRQQEPEPTPSEESGAHETGDRFAAMLPAWVPAAERGVDDDGDAEFDWWSDGPGYRTLTVCVALDGRLHYAALVEDYRCHGKGLLVDGVPSEVLDALRRMYPTATPPERAPVLAVESSRSSPNAPALTPPSPAPPRAPTGEDR